MNGEHEVLLLEVIGPHLEVMFDNKPPPIQQITKNPHLESLSFTIVGFVIYPVNPVGTITHR